MCSGNCKVAAGEAAINFKAVLPFWKLLLSVSLTIQFPIHSSEIHQRKWTTVSQTSFVSMSLNLFSKGCSAPAGTMLSTNIIYNNKFYSNIIYISNPYVLQHKIGLLEIWKNIEIFNSKICTCSIWFQLRTLATSWVSSKTKVWAWILRCSSRVSRAHKPFDA